MVATIIFGLGTQKIGYYTPFAITGSILCAVGAGLLYTLGVHSSEGMWLGYQVLYGFGMGWIFQAPTIAAQTVLLTRDVPIGTALMFFAQMLGAAVFVSVGENVLDGQLAMRLRRLPGLADIDVTSAGATSVIAGLTGNVREMALLAYAEALRRVFLIGVVLSCVAVLGAVSLEWKSVLKKKGRGSAEKAAEMGQNTKDDKNEA